MPCISMRRVSGIARHAGRHYAALGLPATASDNQIRTAYLKLVQEEHPDKNPGDASAQYRFLRVKEAYDVLSGKAMAPVVEYEEKQVYEDTYTHAMRATDHSKVLAAWDRLLAESREELYTGVDTTTAYSSGDDLDEPREGPLHPPPRKRNRLNASRHRPGRWGKKLHGSRRQRRKKGYSSRVESHSVRVHPEHVVLLVDSCFTHSDLPRAIAMMADLSLDELADMLTSQKALVVGLEKLFACCDTQIKASGYPTPRKFVGMWHFALMDLFFTSTEDFKTMGDAVDLMNQVRQGPLVGGEWEVDIGAEQMQRTGLSLLFSLYHGSRGGGLDD